jgi:NAD(P)H-dependent FMN reductase
MADNGNYSASFKNVFDWCTRISVFFKKSHAVDGKFRG